MAFAQTLTQGVFATRVPHKPLAELVAESDHVLIVEISRVVMVDSQGDPLTSGSTGPGRNNELQLHVAVRETLHTDSAPPPEELVVALWKMWHYGLDQWRKEEGESYIFLLKGKNYERIYPMTFMRPMSEEAEIEKILGELPR